MVASGELDGQFLADSLFHVGNVVIRLTTDPARFADARDERMLAGTLIDETAPNPTPMTTNVTGRLPEGNMPMIHILFLKDERSGSLGTVTFQTADYETAGKFSAHGGTNVGIIIKLE